MPDEEKLSLTSDFYILFDELFIVTEKNFEKIELEKLNKDEKELFKKKFLNYTFQNLKYTNNIFWSNEL